MKIHKEGSTTILITFLLIGLINFLSFYYSKLIIIQLPVFLVSLFFFYLVLHFFRNQIRDVEVNNRDIIAPSYGTLVVLEEVFENEI